MPRLGTRLSLTALFLTLIFSATSGENLNLDVKEHKLENGLTILTLEDHSAPVVSYQVWFKVGSRNERPGITGISHLFEHMMFKGSKNIGSEEHAKLIQANGGIDNAWTSNDNTTYFENLPSDKLELAVRLESERQVNLNITPENLASEREVVKEERAKRDPSNTFHFVRPQLLRSAEQRSQQEFVRIIFNGKSIDERLAYGRANGQDPMPTKDQPLRVISKGSGHLFTL